MQVILSLFLPFSRRSPKVSRKNIGNIGRYVIFFSQLIVEEYLDKLEREREKKRKLSIHLPEISKLCTFSGKRCGSPQERHEFRQ